MINTIASLYHTLISKEGQAFCRHIAAEGAIHPRRGCGNYAAGAAALPKATGPLTLGRLFNLYFAEALPPADTPVRQEMTEQLHALLTKHAGNWRMAAEEKRGGKRRKSTSGAA